MQENIRNFLITAHIDHGKSTLSDRILEETGTVEKRLMKAQFLDQMDLERERGITIKMAPVRMKYNRNGKEYIFNLIDTPGHSDFKYEVSRALAAVEGAVLLVDATQGVQAQTLANLDSAKKAGLTILGAINKIDIATSEQAEDALKEISELLEIDESEILRVSGKTGEGVKELLDKIIEKVPPPNSKKFPNQMTGRSARALVFDSTYHDHKGIIAFVRFFDGNINFKGQENAMLAAKREKFLIKEVGYFLPKLTKGEEILPGEIGYIATGIKNPDKLKIGDTIVIGDMTDDEIKKSIMPGYEEPTPVVFVSFYPEDASDFENFKQAIAELKLNDAALTFEPDTSEILGRGFMGGFLGRLHFEITAERLKREHNLETVHSFPSVAYKVKRQNKEWETITNPKDFPDDYSEVMEPMTEIEILTPQEYLGNILRLNDLYRLSSIDLKPGIAKTLLKAKLPLGDLISDFDDKIKSVSQGYASLNYKLIGFEKGEVEKMEILIATQAIPGLTRIIPKIYSDHEARKSVEKLKDLLPKQQFSQALQAKVGGRILARETISPMRKDVTGYLYGGDRSRKLKLWKKQQRGKANLKERAETSRVNISADIFKELLKK